MQNSLKDEVDIKKIYGKQATLNNNDFIHEYNVDLDGISEETAEERLEKYGLNEIKQAKPKKWYNYFLQS